MHTCYKHFTVHESFWNNVCDKGYTTNDESCDKAIEVCNSYNYATHCSEEGSTWQGHFDHGISHSDTNIFSAVAMSTFIFYLKVVHEREDLSSVYFAQA